MRPMLIYRPVYTCQNRTAGCGFFLWEDEAKPREERAVLSASRTEPVTPTKSGPATTPSTPMKPTRTSPQTPSSVVYPQIATPASENMAFSPGQVDDTDWIEDNEEELSKFVDDYSLMPPPETPRKVPRTAIQTTPGKRPNEETKWFGGSKGSVEDDVFNTPSTGSRGNGLFNSTGLMSPVDTPTPQRVRKLPIPQEPDSPLKDKSGDRSPIVVLSNDDEAKTPPPKDSQLATAILDDLRDLRVPLTKEAVRAVKLHCEKHMLNFQGFKRGRDISRQAIKNKEAEIAELQKRIDHLNNNEAKVVELHKRIDHLSADNVTLRGSVRHLKQQNVNLRAS